MRLTGERIKYVSRAGPDQLDKHAPRRFQQALFRVGESQLERFRRLTETPAMTALQVPTTRTASGCIDEQLPDAILFHLPAGHNSALLLRPRPYRGISAPRRRQRTSLPWGYPAASPARD